MGLMPNTSDEGQNPGLLQEQGGHRHPGSREAVDDVAHLHDGSDKGVEVCCH